MCEPGATLWTAPEEESRAVESRPRRQEKVDWHSNSNAPEKLSDAQALLLYSLFSTLYFRRSRKSGRLDSNQRPLRPERSETSKFIGFLFPKEQFRIPICSGKMFLIYSLPADRTIGQQRGVKAHGEGLQTHLD